MTTSVIRHEHDVSVQTFVVVQGEDPSDIRTASEPQRDFPERQDVRGSISDRRGCEASMHLDAEDTYQTLAPPVFHT